MCIYTYVYLHKYNNARRQKFRKSLGCTYLYVYVYSYAHIYRYIYMFICIYIHASNQQFSKVSSTLFYIVNL